jgi:hypothetical protein
LGLAQLFALSSTFTAVETQANIPTTQSVTTFTVDVAGLDTDMLTLDGCTISFIDLGISDTNCTDGVGVIDSILDSSIDQQATALAGFTFTNYSAAAGSAGKFILTHIGTPADGNPASSKVGTISVSEVNTTSGIATAVAQAVDFIPTSPAVGETFRATIN